MASTLEKLIAGLQGSQPYQPLSQEEIRKQANTRYQSVYDRKRLDAQQSYETEDAALARELSGLQQSYDAQRASAGAQNRLAYSQADRHALARGMQRSSFQEANLASISLAGAAARQEIDEEQARKEAEIGEKRTLLSTQLSNTLRQLNAGQQSDELAYADQLSDREYERSTASRAAADQLAIQLYEYQHQLEVEAAEMARWRAEFNARYGDGSVFSGGGRKNKTAASAPKEQPAKTSGVRKNQKETMY